MKILVCCDSFKDSLPSGEISTYISQNILNKFPKTEIIQIQIADGGEGSLDALNSTRKYKVIKHQAVDALLRKIESKYLFDQAREKSVIELAQTCGLTLLEHHNRNCYHTSTYGIGLQIQHAIELGAKTIDLLIGGSATNDLGIGMAAACGHLFKDGGVKINMPRGKDMLDIDDIDIDNKDDIRFNVICDVDNLLLGANGAAKTYGAQKGASEYELRELEKGAENIVKIISNKYDLNYHLASGSGAAGGVGFGAMTFLNAKMKSGVDYFIEELQLEEQINKADLIITGEGKIDNQTKQGKLISGISRKGKLAGTKVIAIAALNELEEQGVKELHLDKVYSLYKTPPAEISKEDTLKRLELVCQQLINEHIVG